MVVDCLTLCFPWEWPQGDPAGCRAGTMWVDCMEIHFLCVGCSFTVQLGIPTIQSSSWGWFALKHLWATYPHWEWCKDWHGPCTCPKCYLNSYFPYISNLACAVWEGGKYLRLCHLLVVTLKTDPVFLQTRCCLDSNVQVAFCVQSKGTRQDYQDRIIKIIYRHNTCTRASHFSYCSSHVSRT